MEHATNLGHDLSFCSLCWYVLLQTIRNICIERKKLISDDCGEQGSQLPLLLGSGSLPFIIKDLGGANIDSWVPVAYSLTLASVSPFSGYLQDVFGRRNICLVGGMILCVGIIVTATAHTIGQAIAGQGVSGLGAAIGELTALAGTSELVPVKRRGFYLGAVTGCVLPFSPYAIYTTLLGTHSTWRWCFWIPLYTPSKLRLRSRLTYNRPGCGMLQPWSGSL
jgi:MFS family permease